MIATSNPQWPDGLLHWFVEGQPATPPPEQHQLQPHATRHDQGTRSRAWQPLSTLCLSVPSAATATLVARAGRCVWHACVWGRAGDGSACSLSFKRCGISGANAGPMDHGDVNTDLHALFIASTSTRHPSRSASSRGAPTLPGRPLNLVSAQPCGAVFRGLCFAPPVDMQLRDDAH